MKCKYKLSIQERALNTGHMLSVKKYTYHIGPLKTRKCLSSLRAIFYHKPTLSNMHYLNMRDRNCPRSIKYIH